MVLMWHQEEFLGQLKQYLKIKTGSYCTLVKTALGLHSTMHAVIFGFYCDQLIMFKFHSVYLIIFEAVYVSPCNFSI